MGTIASQLGIHPDTVRHALETARFHGGHRLRASITDPYLDFIRLTLEQYPRLRATRIYQMIRERGYRGSVIQLRRLVARLRPAPKEAFLCLRTFPGEQAQVDWGCFGHIKVGRAHRQLSCFVATLSYSRALYLEFFFNQSLESFLVGHCHAFEDWRGAPRTLIYDSLRSAVLKRRGDCIHFHPRLLELCAHYHCGPRPCRPRAAHEKGRVERTIRYIRESFFAARAFSNLEDLNRQALQWRDSVAYARRRPVDDSKTVREALDEERPSLLPLPAHPFDTDLVVPVQSAKTIYVRFDLNDYSIPPEAVGRPLVVVASQGCVRILDGTLEIARHRRCYDRHARILDPAHQEALLAEKRKAFGATATGRLAQAVPECEALLDAAFACGESPGRQTAQLLRLLERFGAPGLRAAAREALERKTPRASSVAFLIHRQLRRQWSANRPRPVDLSHHPELADLSVTPHNLENYDELAKQDNH